MMDSHNTRSAPQPINPRRTSATSTSDQCGGSYFDSPAIMDEKRRTDSYSSDVSIGLDSTPASPPKSSHTFIKPTATVNRYTTCGRHTDQLLFGGPSLTELARSFIRRH
ncbi:hypothetical protein B0T10DRAFT_181899 [Thelonectria olida]|uniref:Uncharacterized protein n=1 Tax=Thelonectria olida TaxID=1576542 RepID=A0A9P9AXH0_9HYPO|nr:hypothetical protein B0T10DRAFT_181899 [Thelonectria olida]